MMHLVLAVAGFNDAWGRAVEKLHAMADQALTMTPNIVIGLVVFLLFFFAGWFVRWLTLRVTARRKGYHHVAHVTAKLTRGITLILGFLVAAVIIFPSFTPARLIDFLGIGSVAIGFAFRDVLQNYLAGILLLLTEPFRIGDQIIFDKYEGTVEDIQTRATFIRTYDGRRVVIPNADLFTKSVLVNTAFEKRRLEYGVGIGYGDDIRTARRVILETLSKLEKVMKEPAAEVLAYELDSSTVNLRVRWWMQPPKKQDIYESRSEVIEAMRYALTDAGIDLPFPTTQVLFHDQTEETDGDRSQQREGWPAGAKKPPKPRSIASAIDHASDGNGKL
jgi:small-conductance mechanosensitive channel